MKRLAGAKVPGCGQSGWPPVIHPPELAALHAGWPESTYRSHEGGTRTIDPNDARRYVLWFLRQGAKGKNFTPNWVIFGDENLDEVSLDELVRNDPAAKRAALDAILNKKR